MIDIKKFNYKNKKIIIFDGECNFCNGAVNFIIKRDPAKLFSFTPVQGEKAQQLLKQHAIHHYDHDTLFLLANGKVYSLSSAALQICKDLSGYWYLFSLFRIIPRPLRDAVYCLFARYRYRLFGKGNSCTINNEGVKKRLL